MSYNISYRCVSHIGKIRTVNQDNLVCESKYLVADKHRITKPLQNSASSNKFFLLGVFDGLGGEECGEVASYIAAKAASELRSGDNPAFDILSLCSAANKKICSYADENSISSMGTTAAMLGFAKKKIILCNIGDSRIYRFNDAGLKQMSEDHVLTSGFGMKPPLTQNLGIPPTEMIIDPYLSELSYCDGDIYLICSDGLTDMVSDGQIAEVLRSQPETEAADTLLDMALRAGGRDNVTIIICKIKRESVLSRIFGRGAREKEKDNDK